jgi:Phenylpropionate dioxygenase and related ring-hydroxylating dioxygenases, large terminal subunit
MQIKPFAPSYRESDAPTYQELIADDRIAPSDLIREYSETHVPVDRLARAEFTSPEFAREELEKMWPRVWQFACREEQIPQPGDMLVYESPGLSLIIARTRSGDIRAFHNSCLHRGAKLCNQRRRATNIMCPFHGFTWNLDGELIKVPARWDFPHLDEAEMRLPQARVGRWGGFVFINRDHNAPPLEDYLGHLVPHFDGWGYDNHRLSAILRKKIRANWKTCMDLLTEVYHIAALHPQALAFAGDSSSQYDIWPDDPHVSRFINPVGVAGDQYPRAQTEQDILDRIVRASGEGNAPRLGDGVKARHLVAENARIRMSQLTGRDFSQVSDTEIADGLQYSLFPNMIIFRTLVFPYFFRFLPSPDDPNECTWEFFVLSPPQNGREAVDPTVYELGENDSFRVGGVLGEVFGKIIDQDVFGMEQSQAGMRSGGTQDLILARYQEARIRHLHQTLHRYLGGEL